MCDKTKIEDCNEIVKVEHYVSNKLSRGANPNDLVKMQNLQKLQIEIKTDLSEDKRSDEVILENSSDSSKSNINNNNFACPSVPSSSGSNKDYDYMTPKSMHNLNLLFTGSNGKKSQNQRRIINNVNIESPIDNRVYMNYPYNFPISPIDPAKLNSKQISNMHSNMPTKSTQGFPPHNYVFNNNDGIMSINIQNKYIYDSRILEKIGKIETQNKKFNRKIEFTQKDMKELNNSAHSEDNNSVIDSSSDMENMESVIKKPQPIIPASTRNLRHSDSIYLTPFQPFSRAAPQMPFPQMQFPLRNMSLEELEKKTKDELAKKKNSCNCKRSKCLKLYCECFANGEYCINCNCTDCSNVIGNEEEKDEVFKNIKDKNPVAMKLNNVKELVKEENSENKIGCNCTKSNCSKKYCECYKAGVQCSETCRCRDCSNASDKCIDHMKKLSKTGFANDNNLAYEYDDFVVEKISVLIEDKKIRIDQTLIENVNEFLVPKNVCKSFLQEDRRNDNNFINENCVVRNMDNSYLIEISKSVFNFNSILNSTPNINKFKKRRREMSIDSMSSKSEYQKMTNTACETNKKTDFKMTLDGVSKVMGKKLELGKFGNRYNN